jgi:hypothetical protein
MRSLAGLLFVTLAGCASAPGAPDVLRCTVIDRGTVYIVNVRVECGGRVVEDPSLAITPGVWSTLRVAEEGARVGRGMGPSGEPDVVNTTESGYVLAVRCTPRDDGRIDVAIRSWWIREAAIAGAIDDEVDVASGEECILPFRQ